MACIVTFRAVAEARAGLDRPEDYALPIKNCGSVDGARAEAVLKLGEMEQAGFRIYKSDAMIEWRDPHVSVAVYPQSTCRAGAS